LSRRVNEAQNLWSSKRIEKAIFVIRWLLAESWKLEEEVVEVLSGWRFLQTKEDSVVG
jgi:hypothetical protein